MITKIMTPSNFLILNAVKQNNLYLADKLLTLYKRINPHKDFLNFNFRDNGSPLSIAVQNGNVEMTKLLLDNGALFELDLLTHPSCLNQAILQRNLPLLKLILDHIYLKSKNPIDYYSKTVASLLTEMDFSKKSPLTTAIDEFLLSTNQDDKHILKDFLTKIYNHPNFYKNNSKIFEDIWKNNSNYFIPYETNLLLNPETYILESGNKDLIELFVNNGMRYISSATLCVNHSLYSHSAMLLTYNKPIKLKNYNSDVAGILYSFELKSELNNSGSTFKEKKGHYMEQLASLLKSSDAYMIRTLVSSKDLKKIKEYTGNNVLELADITYQDVKNSVQTTYDIIDNLKKILISKPNPKFINQVKAYTNSIKLSKKLYTSIGDISYYFSIYTKDALNNVAKNRITHYNVHKDGVLIDIDTSNEYIHNSHTIYEFMKTPAEHLGLSLLEKVQVIEEFLNVQCKRVLFDNGIIKSLDDIEKDNTFSIEKFNLLPKKTPTDLLSKFYYPSTLFFDLTKDPVTSNMLPIHKTSKNGHILSTYLEQFNISPEKYSFLGNNCITTLKTGLSLIGYKKFIDELDHSLSSLQEVHPTSVINNLTEILNNYKSNDKKEEVKPEINKNIKQSLERSTI